jgi:hypothetical protein
MKKLLLLAVAAASFLSSSVYGEKEQINILFIGNSFTFYQNMPDLVKQVAEEENPGLEVYVEKCVYGGQNLFRHWEYYSSQSVVEQSTLTDEEIQERVKKIEAYQAFEGEPENWVQYHEDVVKKIRAGRKFTKFSSTIKKNLGGAINRHQKLLENNPRREWDYVVLQSWQDVVDDLDYGYSQYAQKFAAVAEEQGAEVILYITAPNIQNKVPVTEPQLQERVDREVSAIKALDKKMNPYGVVHMPLAINMIQQGGTDLTFCWENNFHPNQTSTLLTVNMFYSVLFKKSPLGLKLDRTEFAWEKKDKDFDGNDKLQIFDEATKTYLQEMAYKAVVGFEQLTEEGQ